MSGVNPVLQSAGSLVVNGRLRETITQAKEIAGVAVTHVVDEFHHSSFTVAGQSFKSPSLIMTINP